MTRRHCNGANGESFAPLTPVFDTGSHFRLGASDWGVIFRGSHSNLRHREDIQEVFFYFFFIFFYFFYFLFFKIIICNNARDTQIAKNANASVHPVITITGTKVIQMT